MKKLLSLFILFSFANAPLFAKEIMEGIFDCTSADDEGKKCFLADYEGTCKLYPDKTDDWHCDIS